VRILKIGWNGREKIAIRYNPIPIPKDTFENIFRNLYFVYPRIFSIRGVKNRNEILKMNMIVSTLSSTKSKMIIIVNTIVG
jgi:hypothetical protein